MCSRSMLKKFMVAADVKPLAHRQRWRALGSAPHHAYLLLCAYVLDACYVHVGVCNG